MTSSPGMSPNVDVKTILAVDIGHIRTKVALFAQQPDGSWALRGAAAAFSTSQSPREGVFGGIITAIRELEPTAGPLLKDDVYLAGGTPQVNVDAIAASSSAAAPLTLVSLSATAQHSGYWARVASEWSYVAILDAIALDAGMDTNYALRWADAGHPKGGEDVVTRIRLLAPDAILVTGGFNGGGTRPLLEMARLLASARPVGQPPPTVVVAGNATAQPAVARLLAGRADLRTVANVLPAADTPRPEAAGEALDDLYCQRKLAMLNGYGALSKICSAPVLSSARALALAWKTLAEVWHAPVIGMDIGAHSAVVGSIEGGGYRLRVDPNLGVNAGWFGPAGESEAASIQRWLPFPLSKTEIQARLVSRQEHPLAIPQSQDELLFQEALACAIWSALIRPPEAGLPMPQPSAFPVHLVASGGVISQMSNKWRAALMLLNVVEPRGLVRLWMDHRGVIPAIGGLSTLSKSASHSLLQGGVLQNLGLAVCLDGATTPGSKAAEVEMHLPGGHIRRTIAAWGSLHVLPTEGLGKFSLVINLARGVYIPGFDGARSIVLDSHDDANIIFDCRGRPLATQLDADRYQARMRTWLAAGEQ